MRIDLTRGVLAAAVLATALWCGGCGSPPKAASHEIGHAEPLSPSLVMTGAMEHALWFDGRNDDRLGNAPPAPLAGFELVEIRAREHLRIINGRPREFSTTSTRTIERGRVR